MDSGVLSEHFDRLGIVRIAEWDVLSFIYRHGTSLASADRIASLLGYGNAVVGSTLAMLISGGLVERSRNDCGVRVYRLADRSTDDSLRTSLEALIKVASDRQTRLMFIAHFRQRQNGKGRRERGGLHLT